MAELTHYAHALSMLAGARAHLEEAMRTKPKDRAAYSRWIAAHEHIVTAADLLDLSKPEHLSPLHWKLKEVSFGCHEHNSPICTLLVNQHDGRELHIPATDVEVKPSG